MTEKKSAAEGYTEAVAAQHKDPALIPPAVYNAEAMGHAPLPAKNMFISSEMLDRMLPVPMRDESEAVRARNKIYINGSYERVLLFRWR